MQPIVEENKNTPPVIVIDKKGRIGNALAQKLSSETQVIFVSEEGSENQDVVWISYGKKFPLLPQTTYGAIFVVDDEETLTREVLPSLLQKSKEDKIPFILIVSIRDQKILTDQLLDNKFFKIIFVGDVIDKNVCKSHVPKILNQAKHLGKITLPGDGLSLCHPVFFEDTINAILGASFGISSEKIYYAFQKTPISLLSFSHLLQKHNPEIRIDFKRNEREEEVTIINDGSFLISQNYPLESKITDLKIEKVQKLTISQNFYSEIEGLKVRRHFYKPLTFLLLFFIFLPLISTLFLGLFGEIFLSMAKQSVREYKILESGSYVKTSYSLFSLAKSTSQIFNLETFRIAPSEDLNQKINSSFEVANGLDNLYNSVRLYSEGGISDAQNLFKNFLFFAQKQSIEKKEDFISKDLLSLASSTLETWPEILGFNREKKYLALFEDNAILRPEGGVINSYAILTLKNGKIENFELGKTRDLDTKLKGQIEPPFSIRRYLGEKNWLFKDSNYSIDFTNGASQSSYLFALESDIKPDGVFEVNSDYLRSVLGITQEVNSKNYGKLSEKNFISVSRKFASDNDFTFEVLTQILRKIKSDGISLFPLLETLPQEIKNKNISFVFARNDVQNIFTVNYLSNSLWDGRTSSSQNINDFLSFSEANFGGYTSVDRKVVHKVSIGEDGIVDSTSEIDLINSGNEDYKVYLRLVAPDSSILKKITINGKAQALTNAQTDPSIYEKSNFIKPENLEVETASETGKSIFGIYLDVPRNQTYEIIFDYFLKESPIASLSNFSYSFKFSKQSGVEYYPLDLEIIYPDTFRIISFPKESAASGNKLSFSKDVSQDFGLDLNLSKK